MALRLVAALAAFALAAAAGEECTTAVIAGPAAEGGKPILWKNRDTDALSNKVVLVNEKPYRYIAVVNAEDVSGRVAWGGLNDRGFAIINSVAYNLPAKTGEGQDYEGIVMADALRSCATVDDFEAYLKRNLGRRLGVRTNFCLIDARGGAAIFETHNHGYKRLDAGSGYLLNTNWSRSGEPDKGQGYLRYDRETALFEKAGGKLTPPFVLQDVARDLGHALEHHPERAQWKKLPAGRPYWLHSNYTIDRPSTASVMLVHGETLWVMLGEPVCSIAVPLWVAAGEAPPELNEGMAAPLSAEAARLKAILRPLKGRDRYEYLDLTRLDNDAGTGWLPGNLATEREIFAETARFLKKRPAPAELAAFQRRMAAKALARLREVK